MTLDDRCLAQMKQMFNSGYAVARAGTLARRLRCDSVRALGAMLRVERRYRRWVNVGAKQ